MGAEIERYNAHLPERPTAAPSFLLLAGRMVALSTAALHLKEGLHALQRRMDRDADDADRMAEQATAAEVEPRFTALIHEAAASLRVVAEASGEVADSADQMEANSRGFTDAHESEYRGVFEAVRGSNVQQAKAGFYRTR